jgi:hypothetical protein
MSCCVTSQNAAFYNISSVLNYNVEEDEVGRTCGTNGEKRNVYMLLVGKTEGNRPLGRPRSRWIDNIKMKLLEIGLSVVDWIGLAQDR